MPASSPEFFYLNEPDKLFIYRASKEDIESRIIEVQSHRIDERPHRIMGSIFESLAIHEFLANRNEKPYQKLSREIIEELFQNANIVMSDDDANKPDFVSVVFDSSGRLVITEIVEIKTSEEALFKKIESQPQNTLKTIEGVANLFNQIRICENLEDLEIYQKNKNDEKKEKFIRDIYDRIKNLKLGKNQDVVFSEDLKYHVIVPYDKSVQIPKRYHLRHRFKNNTAEKEVSVTTSQSQFSLGDCHKIVDYHLEQK